MAEASFDSEAIDYAGRQLSVAAASLHDLAAALSGLPCHSLPHVVADAIHELNAKGHDMMTDIDEETTGLAQALSQVAGAYADMDACMVSRFTGGGW
jgi:hypothetical protein